MRRRGGRIVSYRARRARVANVLGVDEPDIDAIARDLTDVEVALARLDAGTYWTCEVTGADIPDPLLAEHPTRRRC